MQIILQNHDYRFAVEQTIMALLPGEKIQTIDHYDPALPYLISVLSPEKESATCVFSWNGVEYQGNSQKKHLGESFLVKDAVYEAIVQSLDSKPPWGSLSGVRPGKLASKLAKQGENVAKTLVETYHVDPIRGKLAEECGKLSLQAEKTLENSLSLYVGIPFCPSRCHYCSFFSSDIRGNEPLLDVYLEHLITEIQGLAPSLQDKKITTLYLGGGTPTVLNPVQLQRLLQVLQQEINQENCLEFTVEAGRPDTITQEKLDLVQAFHVDRISINPQTMMTETLEKMGRNHSVQAIHQAYAMAKGKFTINMDLIAGLVGEIPGNFFQSLEEIMDMKPQQITVHSLTTKKNTPLQAEGMEIQSISWDSALDTAWNRLREGGYRPYYLYRQKQITQGLENVGWVLQDSQAQPSLYNMAMMEEFQSILAFGAGAMTKIILPGDIIRHHNPKFPKEYGDKLDSILEKKKDILQNV